MLYQNILTGYLYEAPGVYSRARMVYNGLGEPVGFLTPFIGAAQTALPRFRPVGYQTLSGFGQADLQQQQMPLTTQAPLSVQQMPIPATTLTPAAAMQVPQIPVPGTVPTLAPATAAPVLTPGVPGATPLPASEAGFLPPLYCHCRPQPFSPETAAASAIGYPRRRYRRRLLRR